MSTLLETRALTLHAGEQCVCQPLNLTVHPGEIWGILGANGAGKTTLLHSLARLHPVSSGEILLQQQPVTTWSRKAFAQQVGLLLQDSQDIFPSTVLETALIGRHPYASAWRGETAADHTLAERALAQVGLQDFAHREVHSLSGGERRRLALATLITQSPSVWLLDEPNNHLDLRHQYTLLGELITHIQQHNSAAMISLHDPNLAARFCSHVLLIGPAGSIRHGSVAEYLTAQHLSDLYGYPLRAITSAEHSVFIPI